MGNERREREQETFGQVDTQRNSGKQRHVTDVVEMELGTGVNIIKLHQTRFFFKDLNSICKQYFSREHITEMENVRLKLECVHIHEDLCNYTYPVYANIYPR